MSNLLAKKRQAAKLTQTDLAKMIGLSRAFVSQIELGERGIPEAYVGPWAKAIDLPEADIRRYANGYLNLHGLSAAERSILEDKAAKFRAAHENRMP